jgi:hypothetical protein
VAFVLRDPNDGVERSVSTFDYSEILIDRQWDNVNSDLPDVLINRTDAQGVHHEG